jgi:hypothetical protein
MAFAEILGDGLCEELLGALCRIRWVRRVFGYGPYVEPEPQLTDEQLREIREWEERYEAQYRSRPANSIGGVTVLGLASWTR